MVFKSFLYDGNTFLLMHQRETIPKAVFQDDNVQDQYPGMAAVGRSIPYLIGGFIILVLVLSLKDIIKKNPIPTIIIGIIIAIPMSILVVGMIRTQTNKYGSKNKRVWLSMDAFSVHFNNSDKAPIPLKSVQKVFLLNGWVYFFTDAQSALDADQLCHKKGELSLIDWIFLTLVSSSQETKFRTNYVAGWCIRGINKKYKKHPGVSHIAVNSFQVLEGFLIGQGFHKHALYINNDQRKRISRYYGTIYSR